MQDIISFPRESDPTFDIVVRLWIALKELQYAEPRPDFDSRELEKVLQDAIAEIKRLRG